MNSVLQPRGDIYESGVTPTRLRTRLNERCRQNYRHGHLRHSCFSNVRHTSVHTSRHRIGEASAAVYRLQRCRDTGQRKLRNSSSFYVFSGDGCTMQCIKGKIPLRQLEKNPRFHIAYRQLGVEWYIQQDTLEQLEQFTCLMH